MIILILIVCYVLYKIITGPKYFPKKIQPNKKQAIIFKTHVWNDNIEKFSSKLLDESKPYCDFFIVIHSDNGKLVDKIKSNELKNHVIMFNSKAIKNIYKLGFFSMWLCNHWILAWFYRTYCQNKKSYDYVWSMEYDVRISGDSSILWKYEGNEDFLYPIPTFQDMTWPWKDHYTGKLSDEDKWYGYLQLCRYSNKFLNYLDIQYSHGENGQDEMIIFTLFNKGKNEIGLTGTHEIIDQFINDSWSVVNEDNDKHKNMFEESENKAKIDPQHLQLFHPIKY